MEAERHAARPQLQVMREDFLLRSARTIYSNVMVTLARSGYVLTLSPGLNVVVNYQTQHREGTGEQVRAGVSSRFGRQPKEPFAIPEGPAVKLTALAATLDPSTCVLAPRECAPFDLIAESGVVEAGPDGRRPRGSTA